jgi:hypothetical protein
MLFRCFRQYLDHSSLPENKSAARSVASDSSVDICRRCLFTQIMFHCGLDDSLTLMHFVC